MARSADLMVFLALPFFLRGVKVYFSERSIIVETGTSVFDGETIFSAFPDKAHKRNKRFRDWGTPKSLEFNLTSRTKYFSLHNSSKSSLYRFQLSNSTTFSIIIHE